MIFFKESVVLPKWQIDKVYNAWREQTNLSEGERNNIYEAISYFSGLEYTLIRIVRRYLEHEHDVISAAQNTAPTSEKVSVAEAEKEIEGKIQEVETILGNAGDLFRKLTDPNWVQSFVSLSCYQK